MSRSALSCSKWPEYQLDHIAAQAGRPGGMDLVSKERLKVQAIRAAVAKDGANHPDQIVALFEIDIVLQRFATVLDSEGRA